MTTNLITLETYKNEFDEDYEMSTKGMESDHPVDGAEYKKNLPENLKCYGWIADAVNTGFQKVHHPEKYQESQASIQVMSTLNKASKLSAGVNLAACSMCGKSFQVGRQYEKQLIQNKFELIPIASSPMEKAKRCLRDAYELVDPPGKRSITRILARLDSNEQRENEAQQRLLQNFPEHEWLVQRIRNQQMLRQTRPQQVPLNHNIQVPTKSNPVQIPVPNPDNLINKF